ncbi:acyltransferase family protein [Nonomuraea thailandensis]
MRHENRPRPAPPTRGSASPPRLWFADNLRILLTSLVVLHHIAVMYSGLPLWYYVEPPTGAAAGAVLAIFVVVNQAWFMGAFFLLSGYFTPGSFDRKGPGAFLRDRLVRLGIPLVVFYFVLSPLLHRLLPGRLAAGDLSGHDRHRAAVVRARAARLRRLLRRLPRGRRPAGAA